MKATCQVHADRCGMRHKSDHEVARLEWAKAGLDAGHLTPDAAASLLGWGKYGVDAYAKLRAAGWSCRSCGKEWSACRSGDPRPSYCRHSYDPARALTWFYARCHDRVVPRSTQQTAAVPSARSSAVRSRHGRYHLARARP